MRISHKYKFVFLSNPQSASTTIRDMLEDYSDILGGYEFPFHYHANAKKLKATFMEKGWDWDSYYKFSTVRNPWDKMLARYFYGRRDPNSQWHAPSINSTFDEFLNNPLVEENSVNVNLDNFLYSESGECLVDDIIKVETLDEGLEQVFSVLEIAYSKLIKTNAAKRTRERFSHYYSSQGREAVRKLHTRDIEVGAYCFNQE